MLGMWWGPRGLCFSCGKHLSGGALGSSSGQRTQDMHICIYTHTHAHRYTGVHIGTHTLTYPTMHVCTNTHT